MADATLPCFPSLGDHPTALANLITMLSIALSVAFPNLLNPGSPTKKTSIAPAQPPIHTDAKKSYLSHRLIASSCMSLMS